MLTNPLIYINTPIQKRIRLNNNIQYIFLFILIYKHCINRYIYTSNVKNFTLIGGITINLIFAQKCWSLKLVLRQSHNLNIFQFYSKK